MKDYKRILQGVVNIINITKKSDIGFANICAYIDEKCPELAESEDEKIRKGLINGFKFYSDQEYWGTEKFPLKIKDILAWLEKQGEQKPVFEMKTPEESLGIDSETYNKIVDECVYGEQKPADIIPEDFEKFVEHLLSLSDGEGHGSPAKVKEVSAKLFKLAKLEQKPAWTPMDEQRVENLLAIIEGHGYPGEVAWLNSLKDRVQSKQEWSEENEHNISFLTSIIEECFKDKEKITLYSDTVCADFTKEDVIDRLKSLRPQNRWKPSDEQMAALNDINLTGSISYVGQGQELISLYNFLKKLKEE